MPELAEALIQEHDMRAAPAELSRFLKHRLKHRLGYTYKKILDCKRRGGASGCAPRDTSGGTDASRGCDLSRTGWSLSTKRR